MDWVSKIACVSHLIRRLPRPEQLRLEYPGGNGSCFVLHEHPVRSSPTFGPCASRHTHERCNLRRQISAKKDHQFHCEHLSNSTLGCRRQRAWTCEDAPPQRLATRTEPRLHRPQSMPASLPAALAALWGTKSSYSTDLENRQQKSHGAVRLSAITHGSYIRISLARPEPGSTAFKHSTGGRFPFRPGNVRTGEYGKCKPRGTRSTINATSTCGFW